MPLGGVFPPMPGRAPAAARKRRMLLIHSDPDGTLPAAKAEVDTVQGALAAELEIERVDPDQATNAYINEKLMGQSFDSLHYAGHAKFGVNNPMRSGLLLKDSLLAADKTRLLNRGGSLVFLNACESGTVAQSDAPQKVSYLLANPEPVVGLASAFVYSGAIGCVGLLWPVYDQPAADLAVRFYPSVLAGEPTDEALRNAWADIRAKYPREVTWAATCSTAIRRSVSRRRDARSQSGVTDRTTHPSVFVIA
jgi:CHAT domain-containing protein